MSCFLSQRAQVTLTLPTSFSNENGLYRSSHRRCSIKKAVLENFAKLAGKHLRQSLFFNKVADLTLATLWKTGLWYRCFSTNFTKFLRTPFLQNTSGRLLLLVAVFKKASVKLKHFNKTWSFINRTRASTRILKNQIPNFTEQGKN